MSNVDYLIFGVLLLFGMLYAMLLEASERGIRLVSAQTWMTVVVGVGATLALIGLFPLFTSLEYWKLWAAFAATGAPVVVRSVLHQVLDGLHERRALLDVATPRA